MDLACILIRTARIRCHDSLNPIDSTNCRYPTIVKSQQLTQLKLFARMAIGRAVHWCGVGRLFELATQPVGAIVLMYHSVAPDDLAVFVDPRNRMCPVLFDAQMAYLRKHRSVVPLSKLIEQITSGISPPAGTVCITFDDGYVDNLTIAAPILEKYQLPATLYLATGYIERSETQWADRLHWSIERRTVDRLNMPSLGSDSVDLASDTARSAIYGMLHRHLLEGTYLERKSLLDEIQSQLKPIGQEPRLTLNWNEVRELVRRYPLIEIGGHTREHIDLRKHHNEVARSEIVGCAEDIRRELGVSPDHFSFPYGRWCDEARHFVRASDWQSAVGINTTVRVDSASDRYSIPRVEAPQTLADLRFKTSGAYPGVLAMFGLR